MKWVVLSDIHGNLPAFEAVMKHFKEENKTYEIVFTGDVVGYGPYPNECIEELSNLLGGNEQLEKYGVAGNSDMAAVQDVWRRIASNPEAQETLKWTAGQLKEKNKKALEALSQKNLSLEKSPYTFVHATFDDPTGVKTGSYMDTDGSLAVDDAIPVIKTPIGIYGHSHRPLIYKVNPAKGSALFGYPKEKIEVMYSSKNPKEIGSFTYNYGQDLEQGCKLFACMGSIGQPRDHGDPRAAYGMLDDEAQTITFYRIPYEIEETIAGLEKLPLPKTVIENLSRRLKTGI